ncbi:unnamed protein product [marine sediment metagenome]|uniref:Uncharacterized protein n=1 Tax=marine sediment metagenome TaxID=412755 RepID=X1LUH9_9ZZZZ
MFNKQRKETMGREKTIKPNRSEKGVSPDASGIILEKIEYYRQKRPPTLSQYIYRRAVKESMAKIKGRVGVTVNPGTGLPVPESALAAREALKGLTTEKILAENPSWKEDYERDVQRRGITEENIYPGRCGL